VVYLDASAWGSFPWGIGEWCESATVPFTAEERRDAFELIVTLTYVDPDHADTHFVSFV